MYSCGLVIDEWYRDVSNYPVLPRNTAPTMFPLVIILSIEVFKFPFAEVQSFLRCFQGNRVQSAELKGLSVIFELSLTEYMSSTLVAEIAVYIGIVISLIITQLRLESWGDEID